MPAIDPGLADIDRLPRTETNVISLLDDRGSLADGFAELLTQDDIREAMRLMLLSRAIDDRVTKLQRLGRAGTYSPVHGQEATVVGSALALDPARDWMVPASREQPAMIRHGLPLDRLLAGYMGKINFSRIPDNVRLLPRNQSIASQLPHAVGLAWALKLRHVEGVALVYFGDGASSEGDFHEAMNLAGVQSVPVIFVLINNQFAISTPVAKQAAVTNLAVRAAGYGFPGFTVDGNDLFAVYAVTRWGVTRALAGSGPTLVEARTYRVGFHNTSDNPKDYRDELEVTAAVARDPIERLRKYAIGIGAWSTEIEIRTMRGIATELEAAYLRAVAVSRPGPGDIFEHTSASLSTRVRRQRRQVTAEEDNT